MENGFSGMIDELKNSPFPILILGNEAVNFFKNNYKGNIIKINSSSIILYDKISGIYELDGFVDFNFLNYICKNNSKVIVLSKEELPLKISLLFSKIIKYREQSSNCIFANIDEFLSSSDNNFDDDIYSSQCPQLKFYQRRLEENRYSLKLLSLME